MCSAWSAPQVTKYKYSSIVLKWKVAALLRLHLLYIAGIIFTLLQYSLSIETHEGGKDNSAQDSDMRYRACGDDVTPLARLSALRLIYGLICLLPKLQILWFRSDAPVCFCVSFSSWFHLCAFALSVMNLSSVRTQGRAVNIAAACC